MFCAAEAGEAPRMLLILQLEVLLPAAWRGFQEIRDQAI